MTTTITYQLLLVSLLLLVLINPLASSLKFLPERKKKQLTKKREKEGWRKTKDGWLRLDLPPDSMLRVGVTYRPNDCPWVSSFLLMFSPYLLMQISMAHHSVDYSYIPSHVQLQLLLTQYDASTESRVDRVTIYQFITMGHCLVMQAKRLTRQF